MVGWHHQLNGHEFEQTQGDGEGQESLVRCSPWGRKESDMTEQGQQALKYPSFPLLEASRWSQILTLDMELHYTTLHVNSPHYTHI